jgi:hypothetical protein
MSTPNKTGAGAKIMSSRLANMKVREHHHPYRSIYDADNAPIVHAAYRCLRVTETRHTRTTFHKETAHVQRHIQLQPRLNTRIGNASDTHPGGEKAS